MRRMLTDKLTKSIKEVVNAYNEGEFSAVTANPETTTETLTGIEINGTGYAVEGGGTEVSGTNDGTNWTSLTVGEDTYAIPQGGSVDIDNKTIIENADGKLETAVGGYTEIQEITLTPVALVGSGSDWDLVDETLCNEYLSVLEDGVHYPVELTFTGTTVPAIGIKSAELYKSTTESGYGYGGGATLHITDNNDNVHNWQFYVKQGSTYNIHVWPSDTWISPESGSTLNIAFETITNEIIHQINKKYIDYVYELNSSYKDLTNEQANDLLNKILNYNVVFKRIDDYYYLDRYYKSGNNASFEFAAPKSSINTNADLGKLQKKWITVYLYGEGQNYITESTVDHDLFRTDNSTIQFKKLDQYGNVKLSTIIGGGYSDKNIPITSADFTASGTDYICSNSDFQNGFIKTLCSINLNNGWDSFNVYFKNQSGEVSCHVNVSSTSSDNIFTFTLDTVSSGTIEYNANTGEYTISNILFNNVLPDLISSNNVDEFGNDYPQYAQIKELVNSGYLPGFNAVPTTAGTYTLQATVDAQGNVTYNWIVQA